MRTFALILLVLTIGSVITAAQTPATSPAAAATTGNAPVPPADRQGFSYNAEGRRDPFVSLVRRTTEASGTSASPRPRGLAGLGTNDVALKGTIRGRDGWLAVVRGIDNKTYLVHAGDKLFDGSVRAVTADAMVIVQKVSDPLSPQAEREVRKPLRQTPEAH